MVGVEPVEQSRRTRDAARLERERRLIARQPELWLGGVSYGWLAAAFDSIARLRAPGAVEAITVPTLVVGAGSDTVVCNRAQRRLVARLPRGRYVEIRDAFHEVLMERDAIRQRFWSAFDAFTGWPGDGDMV